jgi:ABC-type bacteriocin/lantibiotic exporter with double-glycine peptidase domain
VAGQNTGSGKSPVYGPGNEEDHRVSNGSLEVNLTSEKTKQNSVGSTATQTRGDHTENSLEFSGGIKITSVTAKWTEDLPENTLTDVSLEVRPGALMAIIGPVGSGKVSNRYRK